MKKVLVNNEGKRFIEVIERNGKVYNAFVTDKTTNTTKFAQASKLNNAKTLAYRMMITFIDGIEFDNSGYEC